MLVNGKIPAFTECPYKVECKERTSTKCFHNGDKHVVDYSCGMARFLKLILKEEGKK